MRGFVIILVMGLLFTYAASAGADPVENPKTCKQCGMDREDMAHKHQTHGGHDKAQ